MKKILYLLSILALTTSCCGEPINTASAESVNDNVVEKVYLNTSSTKIYTVNIEGHTYLALKGLHGESIIHAEHCECKNK